ncbi:hypothetical protein Glove_40g76 [Diversispora epigaea]|uniref:Serine-threonine/tyrosine-protein kinase catalytic domain-containing protein n=1 Tax=Diversispora epigaea TaxID=1348612 RepID=A0A397JIP6_9GLOM|nr:hypothetical protein Glove_40g76 [Diversispora epigaea]
MDRFRSVEYLTLAKFTEQCGLMDILNLGIIKNQFKFRGGWEIVIYGITFNPKENEYMMIFRYKRYTTHGSLRNILNNEFTELTWKSKIKNLLNVIVGLAKIHEFGLMHKDLHSGNIINITDFVFTSYSPYYNVPHDANLVMGICKGLKPEIKCEIPQLLKDLMGILILFIYYIYGKITLSHLETLVCDEYTTHGSLRNILNNEFTELTWKSKIKNLLNVIVGLAKIHEFGLMHKDLHSGNIINITDFGL